jgi:Raf kinase inhibitor-like YbhB/YbcL family protein
VRPRRAAAVVVAGAMLLVPAMGRAEPAAPVRNWPEPVAVMTRPFSTKLPATSVPAPLSVPTAMALTPSALAELPSRARTAAEAHETWGFGGFVLFGARPRPTNSAAPAEGAMQINSKFISPGGEFPKRETCDGQDTSPQLAWSGAPPAAKSFALILDDPDAPRSTFTHWVVWNIPAGAQGLPESVPKAAELTDGTRQGRNDFGRVGYGGPCPPPGKPHRYFFRVYALDNAPAVKAGAGREELERALQGHILARGELMGRYAR